MDAEQLEIMLDYCDQLSIARKEIKKTVILLPNGSEIVCCEPSCMLSLILPFHVGGEWDLHCPVKLGESKIHGRGVFTTRFVPLGTLLTLYPADVIHYYQTSEEEEMTEKFLIIHHSARISCEKKKSEEEEEKELHQRLKHHCLTVNQHIYIYGDPRFDLDEHYLGHFINDRFCGNDGTSSLKLEDYEKLSSTRANCKFVAFKNNTHIGVVATRDISMGEELFANYGMKYWQDHPSSPVAAASASPPISSSSPATTSSSSSSSPKGNSVISK